MSSIATFKRYADLTNEQRGAIMETFRSYDVLCQHDVGHAVACTAHSVFFGANDRGWNSKRGSDAFAATLAVLAMNDSIKLVVGESTARKAAQV